MGESSSKKENNKLKTIAFLGILAVLIIAASLAVSPRYGEVYDISKTDRKRLALEKEKKNSIDVVFAGDSVVYRAISPLQIYNDYGFSSYDLSDSALRLCDAASMIETAYENQTPSLIVLETDALFTDASPHRDRYAIPTNFLEDIFPIFHYHVFYKTYLPDFATESATAKLHDLLKGFEYTDSVIAYEDTVDYMNEGPSRARLDKESLEYLEEINAFAKEKNAEFLLLTVPRPAGWNKARHDAVENWAEDNDIKYLDLNIEDIGIDWETDTMDAGDHMSFEGSKKVSNYLGKYISENYTMEDHRGDPDFDSWTESYREAGIY